MRLNLSKTLRVIVIFTAYSMVLACSGGGGCGGGSVGTSPTLTSVAVVPDRVAAGLTVNFTGSFSFTDPDGDLNGGAFYYTYDGNTYSFPLPPQLQGISDGTVSFQLLAVLGANVGVQDVPCWLVDGAGNSSNIFHVNFTQVWTRQFGTALDDFGYGVSTDSTNSVIVVGTTGGALDGETNLGGNDVFVTKYTSGATQVWTRQISSGNNDDGKGVAVDSIDNIYVTGSTVGALFDGQASDALGDGFVTKFTPTGASSMVSIDWHTPGADDGANAVAVDATNSIYVTGHISGNLNGESFSGGRDAFLIKYDVDGTVLWTRLLGTAEQDYSYGVATDSNGYVYVAGGTNGVLGVDPSPGDPIANSDAFVAKFDTNGNLQWITQLGTPCTEWAKGIAVDSGGNVIVAGRIYQCAFPGNSASGGYDAFIARLDANGVGKWLKQFGSVYEDSANSVTADSSGNAYVTGYLDSAYFTDNVEGHVIFLAKYDASGNKVWIQQESAGTSWGNQGLSLTMDGASNIFLTGTLQGQLDGHTNTGGNDVFILKYDTTGIIK